MSAVQLDAFVPGQVTGQRQRVVCGQVLVGQRATHAPVPREDRCGIGGGDV
ncbi:hypothetical protein [Mycobacterium sp.]|uniref:hypothetical protein n=1 Tax=Mycobacterium sp. TaxID=1785 RepID=UPI0025E6BEAB|nr:hypothetical protein [Mycobacterium sp.]